MSVNAPAPPTLHPGEIALFFDVDGTLIEIAPTPDGVHVPDELRTTLDTLSDMMGGALALVSGRSLEQLDGLFAPVLLNAAGLHGLERRNMRRSPEPLRTETDRGVMARSRDRLAKFVEANEGTILEDKGQTLALHYRLRPELQDEARVVADEVAAASDGTFIVLRGKMVFELKPPHAHKGGAIEAFLGEEGFSGRQPVFLGDDVTDEAGFEAVNRLGGVSIRIGTEGVETTASYALPDVSSVHRWLAELARAAAP